MLGLVFKTSVGRLRPGWVRLPLASAIESRPTLVSGASVGSSGVWDEAGNPVSIYAASELPEPGYSGVVGVFLLVAAYAVRRARAPILH